MKDWNETTALTKEEKKALGAFTEDLKEWCIVKDDIFTVIKESKPLQNEQKEVIQQSPRPKSSRRMKNLENAEKVINTWKDIYEVILPFVDSKRFYRGFVILTSP